MGNRCLNKPDCSVEVVEATVIKRSCAGNGIDISTNDAAAKPDIDRSATSLLFTNIRFTPMAVLLE